MVIGASLEQKELGLRIALDLDRSVVNTIIDPVLRDLKPLGDLRHGEMARDAAGMRLTPLYEESMAKTNDLDRADQHDGPFRRAVALPSQVLGDLSIRLPLPGHASQIVSSISPADDRRAREFTVTGISAVVVSPPFQTILASTESGALRRMTTLSIRQRSSAFFCG